MLRERGRVFLAFAEPEVVIPQERIILLNTPVGAQVRQRFEFVVPIRAAPAIVSFVPVNAISFVPLNVVDMGPSTNLFLVRRGRSTRLVSFKIRP